MMKASSAEMEAAMAKARERGGQPAVSAPEEEEEAIQHDDEMEEDVGLWRRLVLKPPVPVKSTWEDAIDLSKVQEATASLDIPAIADPADFLTQLGMPEYADRFRAEKLELF